MGPVAARFEGAVDLPDGRRLGFAEFGVPSGEPVVWFHGTPGARRQIPPAAHVAAKDRGVRIISIERPGVGLSTSHQYAAIADVTRDVEVIVDSLGVGRFAVVGLSGGGPYALACAHALAPRVYAAAVLGGVVPTVGAEACDPGWLLGLTCRIKAAAPVLVTFGGVALWTLIRVLGPVGNFVYDRYAALQPPGDQAVFATEGMREMFIGDLRYGGRRQFRAVLHDVVLFGRHWGFELGDIDVPVRWWHGDADPIVPLPAAERAAALLPDVVFKVRPAESHLGGFAAASEVLETLHDLRPDAVAASL